MLLLSLGPEHTALLLSEDDLNFKLVEEEIFVEAMTIIN